MPIVRLSRDKRGLDTVYLIHTATDGRRAGRSRVLYFWTAPPDMRVGREAFDEARRRAIEAAHPDVAFDWADLMRALELARQQVPVPGALPRREAWRASRPSRGRQRSVEVSDAATAPDADGTAEPAAAGAGTAPAMPSDGASQEPTRAVARARRRRRGRRSGTDAQSSSADL